MARITGGLSLVVYIVHSSSTIAAINENTGNTCGTMHKLAQFHRMSFMSINHYLLKYTNLDFMISNLLTITRAPKHQPTS